MNELRIAKYGQCNNYSIFIASRFFNSLQDYINLEMAVKRFRGNLDKFFYNPISLTKKQWNTFQMSKLFMSMMRKIGFSKEEDSNGIVFGTKSIVTNQWNWKRNMEKIGEYRLWHKKGQKNPLWHKIEKMNL